MPFDAAAFPAARRAPPSSDRPIAAWLFALAGMIWVMVVLGGATRLTGSGLSIMEWAPLSGALPPLSEAEWQRLFALYRDIPQYALLHDGMTIDGFRQIFWLEWAHRLWGRLLALAFVGPLLWFWIGGRLRGGPGRRLLPRLGLILAAGALQGGVGWFMVASGFLPDSTAVEPARLVAHLSLALLLFAAVLWSALSLWTPHPGAEPSPALRALSRTLLGCVALTMVAGGFVAGRHAGLDYNTFPLMAGAIVPPGYGSLSPWPLNLVANVAAVQFDHRLLATLSAALALAAVAVGATRPAGQRPAAVAVLSIAMAVQYALGVATLLYVVPAPLAVAHQATGVLVLAATLCLVHATRRHAVEMRSARRQLGMTAPFTKEPT